VRLQKQQQWHPNMIGKLSIELGGKTRHLTFGQNAWYIFCKLHGINISDIGSYFGDSIHNPDAFRDLTYAGLKAFDLSAGNEVDYNAYTVGDWLDEAGEEVIGEVLNCILESRSQNTALATKKKVSQKK